MIHTYIHACKYDTRHSGIIVYYNSNTNKLKLTPLPVNNIILLYIIILHITPRCSLATVGYSKF